MSHATQRTIQLPQKCNRDSGAILRLISDNIVVKFATLVVPGSCRSTVTNIGVANTASTCKKKRKCKLMTHYYYDIIPLAVKRRDRTPPIASSSFVLFRKALASKSQRLIPFARANPFEATGLS